MAEESCADTASLGPRRDVSMAHKHHLTFVLNAHDPGQTAFLLGHPELDASIHLARQLIARHVRLVPAVSRDHSPIRVRCVVDNREYSGEIPLYALSND